MRDLLVLFICFLTIGEGDVADDEFLFNDLVLASLVAALYDLMSRWMQMVHFTRR